MKLPKIGHNIKYLRRMRALTQQELANLACITKSYLSSLENDKADNVSLYIIFNVASALGVTVDQIIGLKKLEDSELEYLMIKLQNTTDKKRKDIKKILEILLREE